MIHELVFKDELSSDSDQDLAKKCCSCKKFLSGKFWMIPIKENNIKDMVIKFCCFECIGNDYFDQKIEAECLQPIQELPKFFSVDTVRLNNILNMTKHPLVKGRLWFNNRNGSMKLSLMQAFSRD